MQGEEILKIRLTHGSGGKKTEELIRRIFSKYISSDELSRMDDGGIFDKNYVVSTDSFVVNPVFFPGGNIGDLSICGTVNDLASMGAQPLYFTLGFIIEEGFDSSALEEILSSMKKRIEEVGISVISADTKVVEARDPERPGLFINSTGIGRIYREIPGLDEVESGDVVIVTGAVGEHGFAVLSHRLNLTSTIKSDTKPLWPLIKNLLDSIPVKFMRDPTRGGLAQTLNEIVDGRNFGIDIEEEKVPISEEVRGLSELLGIDPLEVANEGCMIVVVSENHAPEAVNTLRQHLYGQNASIIGRVTDEHPGVVVVRNPYGARRILHKLIGEKLPRIC